MIFTSLRSSLDIEKSLKKERDFPLGTIRNWADGRHIKFDDTPNTDNWMLVPDPGYLETLSEKMDEIGKACVRHDKPISGELLLDHIIDEFYQKRSDFGRPKFLAQDFKKYGWGKTPFYGFSNVFIWEKTKRKAEEKRQKKYAELNAKRKAEGLRPLELEPLEVNEVSIEEIEELRAIIYKAQKQLEKGFDFDDPEQATLYEQVITFSDDLKDRTIKYQGFKKVREGVRDYKKLLNTVFEDNWGVRVTVSKIIDDSFKDYISRHKEEIREEAGREQQEMFGVSIDAPTDEFYKKIKEKVFSASDPEEYPFSEICYLRYVLVLKKDLDGQWAPKSLSAIENFERTMLALPPGHLLENEHFKQLDNHGYSGGQHGGYAFYSPAERKISLSDQVLGYASSKGDLTNPDEFNSVLAHEIGHAVSRKFRDTNSYEYKVFTYLCGWDNRQQSLESTAGQHKVKREGSRAYIELISDYAHQSREEAFAEYYSFYWLNKKSIDNWLKTGDVSHLKKRSGTIERKSVVKRGASVFIKSEGLTYRNSFVPWQVIVQNKPMLQIMKRFVFENEKIIKAIENSFSTLRK